MYLSEKDVGHVGESVDISARVVVELNDRSKVEITATLADGCTKTVFSGELDQGTHLLPLTPVFGSHLAGQAKGIVVFDLQGETVADGMSIKDTTSSELLQPTQATIDSIRDAQD